MNVLEKHQSGDGKIVSENGFAAIISPLLEDGIVIIGNSKRAKEMRELLEEKKTNERSN